MASPPSNDYHVNMNIVHLEENNTEHADNLWTLLAERHSKDLQQGLLNKMTARMQSFPRCKSPVSPLQFDRRESSHHHLQHNVSFLSNSSSSSNSWSSEEQGSPCNKDHIHFACSLGLSKRSKGNWKESALRPTPQHNFRDVNNELKSLPSLNNVIDGKQGSPSHTPSVQQFALTEGGYEPASSLSPRQFNNHSGKSTSFHNACTLLANASIQKNPLGVSTNPLEDRINKPQPSSSPRSPSPRPRRHLQHPPPALMAELHSSFNPSLASSASDAPNLSDASSALRTSLSKAHQIQQQIEASSSKLEYAALRVPALQLAMGPMTSDSADMRELCSFIDQTTGPALAVLEAFKIVEKLAPAIKAGPAREEGVGTYLEQVSSLESWLRFLHGNSSHVVKLLQGAVEMLGGSRVIDKFSLFKFKEILSTIQLDTSFLHDQPSFGLELLECASAHLESHFAHIISNNALIIQLPAATSSESPYKDVALLPEASLHALQAIVKSLSSSGKLHQCLCVYEKAREGAIRKILKTLGVSAQYLGHSSPEAVQALQWETLEEHISTWLYQMEVVVRILLLSERKLISHVFDQCSNSKSRLQWQACFARLALKSALQHWLKFGVAVARSHKEPQKLFKLLDMFECVEGLRPIVEEDVLSGDACKRARQYMVTLQRELGKGAYKVLRAFGAQVEGDKDAVAPPDGGVMKLASYVVNYVKCLVGESYRPLIQRIMQDEAGDGDQLKAAMLHVMQALERNVESKAKGLQVSHPALGQLFLMNNHWYIYTRSKNTELAMILGTPWLKQHKLRAEKCAMRYRREAWGALLSVWSGSDGHPLSLGRSGVSRGILQQRILEFEDAFVELYRLHESWSVPDPVLRPQLGITVLHSFVPELASLFGQFAPFLPSALQMAYTPQRIQRMIAALFEIPETNLKPPIPQLVNTPAKLRSFH